MTATWNVAKAGVRRRRMQTVMIGLIVALCTTTLLVGLAILVAVSGPFDRSFAQLNGAHATAMFDGAKASEDRIAATAQATGVEAHAGPFPVAISTLSMPGGRPGGEALRVIGRADPAGGVDELKVAGGRWPKAANEIVVSTMFRTGPEPAEIVGRTFTLEGFSTAVTVVGIAYSVTGTGDVWMLPEAVRQIGVDGYQMLYRFDSESVRTADRLSERISAVTAGLPTGAVTGTSMYLTVREQAGQSAKTASTFLSVFAVLSLIVAIMVISNVVSGAVIAGFRSIGVLKAVGFTPGQVTAVYLLMMTGPAVIGSAAGAVLGYLFSSWLLGQMGGAYILGVDTTPAPWVSVVSVLATMLLVALTAFLPALRAGRLPAATALAPAASQHGRGRAIQRRLSRSRIPRSISLGLALPVVRPARTLLTLVAVVLGSATVVFATGLLSSANRWNDALTRLDHVQVVVFNPPPDAPVRFPGEEKRQEQNRVMTDAEVEAFLRGVPGAQHVTVTRRAEAGIGGITESAELMAVRGDSANLGYRILEGRWLSGSGEAVVGTDVLRLTGKSVGDTITLYVGQELVPVRIVGEAFANDRSVFVDQASVPLLDTDPLAFQSHVGLAPGVTAEQFIKRVAESGDAGLLASTPDEEALALVELIIVIGTLTTLLVVVSALGVAHTVVLNTRERRRDLAIVKAVGMTPAQVVVMAVTSMAALGVIGGLLGLPGGVAAQQWIIRLIGDSESMRLPSSIVDVYSLAGLGGLLLCGIAIAVLGSLIPARRAARVSTAEALHTE